MNRVVVRMFVFALATVMIACADEKDSLLRAAQDGDLGRVQTFLDGGADINVKDKTTRTPLMYATIKNHQEIVQLLLDRGADANTRNDLGETALTLAAREGHPEIAQALLRKGANVNVQDNGGLTPVVYAAQFNHPATLKVLLDEGRADVSGDQGQRALRAAQEHPDLVELLTKAGSKED